MNNVEKFENFIISIIKISIILTIIEQLLSLIGFRGFFENFYASSGVVSSNQMELKA